MVNRTGLFIRAPGRGAGLFIVEVLPGIGKSRAARVAGTAVAKPAAGAPMPCPCWSASPPRAGWRPTAACTKGTAV